MTKKRSTRGGVIIAAGATIILASLFFALQKVAPFIKIAANQELDWKVTGTNTSGSVGDTVSLDFSITLLHDSCAGTEVNIKTVDEARQKISLVGITTIPPSDPSSVSTEEIEWTKLELEAGVPRNFTIKARIDRGTVGDEIDGFYIYTYACGRHAFNDVVDDMKIKVVAGQSASTPKPTNKPTATPIAYSPQVSATTPTTKAPTPTTLRTTPTAKPVNPVDPDGDGLANDQEALWDSNAYVFDTDSDGTPDGEEVRNGTNPAGDIPQVNTAATFEPALLSPSPLTTQPSFFKRITSGIGGRFRTIGNWFTKIFH